MADTNGGGYTNERLDRVEAILNQVAADHVLVLESHQKFVQEHQMLLKAQVVMQGTLEKLAASQQATDDRLNALIGVVDGWISAYPRPAA